MDDRDARKGGSGQNLVSFALSEESIPTTIAHYEILRKLATGGMAELFLAKQSRLDGFEQVVVIKRILSDLAQHEEIVSMFLDEARIAAKLSHPNIAQIYDLGKADGSYYIAMEYVSGRNIQQIMEKQHEQGGTIPVEYVCRIIAGVCEGLHYAHSRKDYDGRPLNIVHRDISPQNILLSFGGGVKVVDFGIAKASTHLTQTHARMLAGKYAYMCPEHVRGQKVDHRSDLFALGLVMYEMLAGRRAFERESSLKTLKAIVQEKPLNPRELNPDVPVEVVKLLSRALEKNPDRRYKNGQDFQLAIEDYLESSPKRSNNVRLSRYLYELFDDELNSKQGMMVVEGVGEVIISTGVSQAKKRDEPADAENTARAGSSEVLPTQVSPLPRTVIVEGRLRSPMNVTNVSAAERLKDGVRLAVEAENESSRRDAREKRVSSAQKQLEALEQVLVRRLQGASANRDTATRWRQRLLGGREREDLSFSEGRLLEYLSEGRSASLYVIGAWLRWKTRLTPPALADELQHVLGIPDTVRDEICRLGELRNVLAHRTEYELDPARSFGLAAGLVERSSDGTCDVVDVPPAALDVVLGVCRRVLERSDGP